MGSFSESCGFSGLEIGEGEIAYVCIVGAPKYAGGHGPFTNFEPKTTLIRGTYDDYGYLRIEDDEGILAIFNEQAQLELKNGDDFALDMLDGRADVDRWWMHGSMFDFLPSIKPEFPYSWINGKNEKITDIGEATRCYFDRARAVLADALVAIEKARSIQDDDSRALSIELATTRTTVNEALGGYGETRGLDRPKLLAGLTEGVNFEPRLRAWERVWILEYAMSELRKKLVPSEGIGPQHNGHVALDQFAVALRRIIRERKKRWD